MSQSALQKSLPATLTAATVSPEQMALAALRHEIDHLDDEILALFERRLALASRVGAAKDAPTGPHTKLRPDREQAVMARMLAAAGPENQEAVAGLWREIVGWGLARQGRLQVQVWSPSEPTDSAVRRRRPWPWARSIRRPCRPDAASWSASAATPATAAGPGAGGCTPTMAGTWP